VHENYRMGVPEAGYYSELFNSDAAVYGGGDVGNGGGVHSEPQPWMGKPHSITLRLPPLGAIYLKLRRD
jgi:1,4-alpha-glucan branching enzyme